MVNFLTLEHVTHHYFSKEGYTKAIDNISFSVDEGEFVSILGPSGCGKSTILSIIAGIIKNTQGNVYLEGKPIKDSKLAIGYMLQQDYLFPWKTIMNNILLGPKINRKNTDSYKKAALELLQEVGLQNVENQYPSSLSGGMRQRAALVRTLINDPKILLLDEPFSALDYQTKLKLEDLVGTILKTYNKTAILVTHDIGEAIAMSDRILLMNKGPGSLAKIFSVPKELREETPLDVRKHPQYQILFDEIWEELDKREETGKVGVI